MNKLLKAFVKSVLVEANLGSILAQANKDDRGLIVIAQSSAFPKIIVFSPTDTGFKVSGYVSLRRIGSAYNISYLYALDARASAVILLAALDQFGQLIVDIDMSPASSAVVRNYFKSYKDDPSLIEVDGAEKYVTYTREKGSFENAIYKGPVGLDLHGKITRGAKMIDDYSKMSGIDTESLSNDLENAANQGFKTAYSDNDKTGRNAMRAARSKLSY